MNKLKRPIAFVICSTNHGTMLVNKNDYYLIDKENGYGVGYGLFKYSVHEPDETEIAMELLKLRKHYYGSNVVAIDCGANIGTHTIGWSKLMYEWGSVISFEAQERIFYALAGNITINNCFNARAIWAAVGERSGCIEVPLVDYFSPSSYASLELVKKESTEFIGQNVDYDKTQTVKMVCIDELELERLDFIKIDVEGMEIDVLKGAKKTIQKTRPQMMIEKIKSDEQIISFLSELDYKLFSLTRDILAIHKNDLCLSHINF